MKNRDQETILEPARRIPVIAEPDVLVCGGGPAGVAAALAAARSGAKTMLLEDHVCLGGMATAGMLNRLGPYHDQKNIILGGLPMEILRRLVACGMAQEPVPVAPEDWQRYWLVFDPEAMKLLLDEMTEEAGVDVLLTVRVVAPLVQDGTVTGAVIESKSGRQAVRADVVVDATGDGDIAAAAGAPFEKGRGDDRLMQPITLMSKFLNEDWPVAFEYVRRHHGELLDLARREVGNDFVWAGTDNVLHPEETYYNCVHVHRIDATDARDLTRAAVEMRRKLWRNMEVLRRHVPGCEDISLITTAAAIGVRESRRILGDYVLNIDDILSPRQFPDQIARYACYVDIHHPGGKRSEYADRHLGPGESYGLPWRCLLPREVENLLVAGRCFSATHEALASARMMPACMAMGEAAGTGAALAIRRNTTPRALDPSLLRETLAGKGVIL